MSPAPARPVPIYVGGHTEAALRRAARVGDGWTSAMMRIQDLRTTIARLAELRAEYGRAEVDFEIQAVCTDRFGLDGYAEQAEAGVTDAIVVPLAVLRQGIRRRPGGQAGRYPPVRRRRHHPPDPSP